MGTDDEQWTEIRATGQAAEVAGASQCEADAAAPRGAAAVFVGRTQAVVEVSRSR